VTLKQRLSASLVNIHKDETHIVKDVSLSVNANELVGLIGPNGAGKSTLLSALCGIDDIASGSISLDGSELRRLSIKEKASRMGWVEQQGSVHWPVSVERLVMLGRIPHLPAWGKPQDSDIEAVESAMLAADVLYLRNQVVTTLSGGEKSRALLARALAAQPTLLFADEPVSALDLGHQLQTMQLLRDYADKNKAAVVVLHDLSLAARYCDKLYMMNEGRIVASGDVSTVLTAENLERVYGVTVMKGFDEVPWIVPLNRV